MRDFPQVGDLESCPPVGTYDRGVYRADRQEKIKRWRNNRSGVGTWAVESGLLWQGCLPVEPDLCAPDDGLGFDLGAVEQEEKLPASTKVRGWSFWRPLSSPWTWKLFQAIP